jgi:hypothetical protein
MTVITINKKIASCAVLGIISLLLFIIGSIEKKDGYFVFAVLMLLASITIFFATEQCIKNIFQRMNAKDTPTENKEVISVSKVNTTSVPEVSQPQVVKLEEVQIKS